MSPAPGLLTTPATSPVSAARLALPILPGAHERLRTLTAPRDAGVAELAGVVESDPALTLAVLRAANGESFAAEHAVAVVDDAITRLGLHAARRVVADTAASVSGDALARSGLDLDAYWRHAVATALLADASAWPNGPRTDAFAAGLLHDVGRLVLAISHPDRYRFVLRRVAAGEPADEAERALFDTDHAAAGRALATAYGLPAALVEAIGGHRDGDGSTLACVTRNGCRLASALGIGDGVTPATPLPPSPGEPGDVVVRSLGGESGIRMKIDAYRAPIATPATGVPAARRRVTRTAA